MAGGRYCVPRGLGLWTQDGQRARESGWERNGIAAASSRDRDASFVSARRPRREANSRRRRRLDMRTADGHGFVCRARTSTAAHPPPAPIDAIAIRHVAWSPYPNANERSVPCGTACPQPHCGSLFALLKVMVESIVC